MSLRFLGIALSVSVFSLVLASCGDDATAGNSKSDASTEGGTAGHKSVGDGGGATGGAKDDAGSGNGTTVKADTTGECASKPCGANGACHNTASGHTCTCDDGFASAGGKKCSDVDECAKGSDNCDSAATCTNTAGSYTCKCPDGYDGDGTKCTNPCDAAKCDAKATCAEEKGKAVCRCPSDYRDANGDGTKCTMDPTCDAMNCDAKAQCMVADGKAACVCPSGYADPNGNGTKCVDEDECNLETDNCAAHATCKNKAGGFTCKCDDGWSGDGVTCNEIDECDAGTDNCNANADCTNTDGSFECACKDGFSGDGLTCDDIDECAAVTPPCDAHAKCDNTEGSYTCTCNKGYDANGTACTPSSCNLTGTFAMLTEVDVAWDAVVNTGQTVISKGTDHTLGWSIRTQTQTGTTIVTHTVPCGGSTTDFCGPFENATYQQTMPDSIWDQANMPTWDMTMTLPNTPNTGEAFVGTTEVLLLGMSLTSPQGAWPASYTAATVTATNDDGDASPSVTSFMRNTGTSSKCLTGANVQRAYKYLPISQTVHVSEIYSGSRTLAYVNGSIQDCDTMKGDYSGPYNNTATAGGPYNNMPQVQGLVFGCKTDVMSNRLCTDAEIKSLYDSSNQQITSSKFTLLRVADNITCAQVRAMDFTP